MELNDNLAVFATLVPDAQRLDFLPPHFGRQMMALSVVQTDSFTAVLPHQNNVAYR
jgi:hypothetical protein